MRTLLVALEAPLPPVNGLRLPLIELIPRLAGRVELSTVAIRLREQRGDADTEANVHLVDAAPRSATSDILDVVRATLSGRPTRVDRTAVWMGPIVSAALAQISPDIIHVFSGRLGAIHRYLPDGPRVITALDAWHRNVEARAAVSAQPRRALLRAEARRVARFVASDLTRFDRVVTVTPQDRDAILAVAPDAEVVVIPNGVDTTRFDRQVKREPGRIVFHGVMDYAPNVLAAHDLVSEILPRVRRDVEASVVLVGRSPDPSVQRLATESYVTVTGEVDDVAPWLGSAAVYVAPMTSGTGIKNKVLEAMASGTAVVGTRLAFQGLDVSSGHDAIVVEGLDEVAVAAAELLADAQRSAAIGAAGRDLVASRYSWDAVADAYVALYRDVTGQASP